MPHRAQESQQRGTLATRLNQLFSLARPPHRAPYTDQEVATAISATGRTVISAKYLGELRTGQRRHLTEARAAAICDFFGVPPRYLTDQDTADQTDQELALLAALRSEHVGHLAPPGQLLRQAKFLMEIAEELQTRAAVAEKLRGTTWEAIGDVLGVTKATAFNRYSPLVKERESAAPAAEEAEDASLNQALLAVTESWQQVNRLLRNLAIHGELQAATGSYAHATTSVKLEELLAGSQPVTPLVPDSNVLAPVDFWDLADIQDANAGSHPGAAPTVGVDATRSARALKALMRSSGRTFDQSQTEQFAQQGRRLAALEERIMRLEDQLKSVGGEPGGA